MPSRCLHGTPSSVSPATRALQLIVYPLALLLVAAACGSSSDDSSSEGGSDGELVLITADDLPGGANRWTRNTWLRVDNATGPMLHRYDPCIARAHQEAGLRRSTSTNLDNSSHNLFINRSNELLKVLAVLETGFDDASSYIETLPELIDECGGVVNPVDQDQYFEDLFGGITELSSSGDRQVTVGYEDEDGLGTVIETLVQQGDDLLLLRVYSGKPLGGQQDRQPGFRQEDLDLIELALSRSFSTASTDSEATDSDGSASGDSDSVDADSGANGPSAAADVDDDPEAEPGRETGAADEPATNLVAITIDREAPVQRFDFGTRFGFESEGLPENPLDLVREVAAFDDWSASVALDDELLVVALPQSDDLGTVLVYRESGGDRVLEAELTTPTVRRKWGYGISVEVEKDVLVVGSAYPRSEGGDHEVHIYRHSNGQWNLEQTLVTRVGEESSDAFGARVAIEEGRVFAYESLSGVTRIVVYEFDGSSWVETSSIADVDSISLGFQAAGNRVAYKYNPDGKPIVPGHRIAEFNGTEWIDLFEIDPAGGGHHLHLSTERIIFVDSLVLWIAERQPDGSYAEPIGLASADSEYFDPDRVSWSAGETHYGHNVVSTSGDRLVVGVNGGHLQGPNISAIEAYELDDSGWRAAGRYYPWDEDKAKYFPRFDSGSLQIRSDGLIALAREDNVFVAAP